MSDPTKDYGAVRAVDRPSFTIGEGILGPDGSGKTTTLWSRPGAGRHRARRFGGPRIGRAGQPARTAMPRYSRCQSPRMIPRRLAEPHLRNLR